MSLKIDYQYLHVVTNAILIILVFTSVQEFSLGLNIYSPCFIPP